MQYSAVAVLALAASVVSAHSNTTEVVSYETVTVDSYTTVCGATGTTAVIGSSTVTLTAYQTFTAACPCTLVKPVTTSSVVYCSTCAVPTSAPVYANTTTPVVVAPASSTAGSVGTTVKVSSTPTPSTITASGANKAFAFSGASLAGLLGLAAYLL